MSVLNKLKNLANKTAKASQLSGGIHEGVKLVEFKEEIDSYGDYNRYLMFKFKKFNEKGETVGEFTHSFMEIDSSSEYVDMKVENLLVQTQSLVEALIGEAWLDKYDPLKGIVNSEQEAKKNALAPKLERRSTVKALEKNVISQVAEIVTEFLASDDAETTFRLKLVYNDKGYINIPNYKFIERETHLQISG